LATYKDREVLIVSHNSTIGPKVIVKVAMSINLNSVNPSSYETLVVDKYPSFIETPEKRLYDPNDPNRFILISIPQSPFTKLRLHIYYDDKYGDFIVCPDLDFIDDDMVTVNSTTVLKAKSISPILNNRGNLIGVTKVDNNHTSNVRFNKPKSGLNTTSDDTSIIRAPGNESESVVSTCETMFQERFNYTGGAFAPLIFIPLGVPSRLFESTPNSELPVLKLFMSSDALLTVKPMYIKEFSKSNSILGIIVNW